MIWKRVMTVPCIALVAAALPAVSNASVMISYGGTVDDQGTGYGNTLHILGLQGPGSADSESGAVLRGMGADLPLVGDATVNHSNTRSVAELKSVGVLATDFGFDLLFDINESGGKGEFAYINTFTLFFTDGLGNLLTSIGINGMATFMPMEPLKLEQLHTGEGRDDHYFNIDLSADQWATFFASDENRIGMSGTISDTSNGAEVFSVAASPVPEPASLMLLAAGGISALGGIARRRRSAASARR